MISCNCLKWSEGKLHGEHWLWTWFRLQTSYVFLAWDRVTSWGCTYFINYLRIMRAVMWTSQFLPQPLMISSCSHWCVCVTHLRSKKMFFCCIEEVFVRASFWHSIDCQTSTFMLLSLALVFSRRKLELTEIDPEQWLNLRAAGTGFTGQNFSRW